MKDLVFSGRDVAEALAAAGRSLGLPQEALRYVVLDRGRPERLGVKAEPARVAVMLEGRGSGRAEGSRGPAPSAAPPTAADFLEALWCAARIEVEAVPEEAEAEVVVRLQGPGTQVLLEDAEADVLAALEHLLQRAALTRGERRRLRLECEGYRERREARLRRRAQALAEAVRQDGRPRETEALNAYERRIVHLVVSELPGLASYSVGEGADRRVTIAPAGPTDERSA